MTMTTKELRIGNILTDGKFLFTADCIEEDTIWSYISPCVKPEKLEDYYIGGDYHFDIDNVEGVPLTEEWLPKLGFELCPVCSDFKNLEMLYYAKDGVLLFFNENRTEHELSDYLAGYGSMRFGEYHVATFKWIKYVHHLQNLYFALTGEELIVSSNRD